MSACPRGVGREGHTHHAANRHVQPSALRLHPEPGFFRGQR